MYIKTFSTLGIPTPCSSYTFVSLPSLPQGTYKVEISIDDTDSEVSSIGTVEVGSSTEGASVVYGGNISDPDQEIGTALNIVTLPSGGGQIDALFTSSSEEGVNVTGVLIATPLIVLS